MSRTTVTNNRTGEVFPRKSRRKLKDKKFFGYRYGDATKPNAKKGEDFINDGYPFETRHKSEIITKIGKDVLNEMLKDIA